MARLKTKKECLKCHAKQGYKAGDIRGGISLILPMAAPISYLSFNIGTCSDMYFGFIWYYHFRKAVK